MGISFASVAHLGLKYRFIWNIHIEPERQLAWEALAAMLRISTKKDRVARKCGQCVAWLLLRAMGIASAALAIPRMHALRPT
jgi:hypothetical protein